MQFSFGKMLAVSAAVLGVLVVALSWNNILAWFDRGSGETLMMYCAAGIRTPVEEIAKEYEEEYGVQVEFKYDGSGALLSHIKAGNKGDVYLAASQSYITEARNMNLADEAIFVGTQHVCVAVDRGNPKNIETLEDLLRDDVRISLAKPEVAAISRAAKKMLEGRTVKITVDGEEQDVSLWKALYDKAETHRETVNQVANDVTLDTAHAGIVWDATAKQYPELDHFVPSVFKARPKRIGVTVLSTTDDPRQALHFLRYLTASDKGLKTFEKYGYGIANGDKWAEKPEIKVFIGGVLRPVSQEIIQRFEEREGANVNVTYNGCGLLVGQMRAGTIPDLYFSCDTSFMTSVQEHFDDSLDVVSTDMVIITAKGNPHGIKTLQDLDDPQLKVGMTNPAHSALGFLCQQLLNKDKYNPGVGKDEPRLWDRVYPRANDQPSTADQLVTLVANNATLDAAIVYRANTRGDSEDALEIIDIDDPDAQATQPIAVKKDSPHKQLALRLMHVILSDRAKQRFEKGGFEIVDRTDAR